MAISGEPCHVDMLSDGKERQGEYFGNIAEGGCDRCGPNDPFYAVVRLKGEPLLRTVHVGRVRLEE
jgi:hypothetical protein